MTSGETSPPDGYLSEDHKRKYTTAAGILGAIFVMLQFALPFGVMLTIMPAAMSGGEIFREADVDNAVFWRDRIYYVERGISPREKRAPSTTLQSLALGPDAEAQTVVELPLRSPKLLAGADGLWLVGESEVARWDGTELYRQPFTDVLGTTSRPFWWRGELAVIEETPSSVGLRVFRDDAWEHDALQGVEDAGAGADCCRFRILEVGGVTHAFLDRDDTVYHRRLGADAEWSVVAKAGQRWQVVALDREPVLFTIRHGGGVDSTLVGWRAGDEGWTRWFDAELPSSSSVGVVATGDRDDFAVLSSTFPGSVVVRDVRDGVVTDRWSHGSAFPFPMPFMLMMVVPYAAMFGLPLLLALVLSGLMRKHRTGIHRAGEQEARMASVWRRALAQLTDIIIVVLPAAIASIVMMSQMADPEAMAGPGFVFAWIGGMLGSLAFAALCLLAIAWLEGAYGVTPGKWIAGIRVLGTDLQPCGFGRAIIRNLLKFVDGMFNFMVGILLVALTENWQRLGDMAARTVVVQVRQSKLPDGRS